MKKSTKVLIYIFVVTVITIIFSFFRINVAICIGLATTFCLIAWYIFELLKEFVDSYIKEKENNFKIK
jgi:ABC-type transport system involved in cytochrome bd biosynthesis fused ATPase/permease subunit